MVQHTARRIDYLVGAAQVLARSEYVGSVSAERSQRGPRRDRNRRRLRDDQRTAGIENWRRWDIWRGRDLRGRHSDRQRNSRERKTANACEKHCSDPYVYCRTTLCGINAFGIAEVVKGLFGCAEQSKVVRSESPEPLSPYGRLRGAGVALVAARWSPALRATRFAAHPGRKSLGQGVRASSLLGRMSFRPPWVMNDERG